MQNTDKNILIIGSGTMGSGIAHSFAQFGFSVFLCDSNAAALNKAMQQISTNIERQISKGIIASYEKEPIISRITPITEFKEVAQTVSLVVEAIPEVLEIKAALFKELDILCPSDTILSSNTSSISITTLASYTNRPEKVIGMHFMNPVPVMSLVEIINGLLTSKETTQAIEAISKQLAKIPVQTADYPGFISNRILMPMINEAIYCVQERVAGITEIDQIMKLGMAHPMGPLQLADYIGLDVCLSILNVLYNGFGNPKYAPCPLLVNMVHAGLLGSKTKKGFYDWTDSKKLVSNDIIL